MGLIFNHLFGFYPIDDKANLLFAPFITKLQIYLLQVRISVKNLNFKWLSINTINHTLRVGIIINKEIREGN